MNGTEPFSLRVVRKWTLLYTSGLPNDDRERRRLELESDMWEHCHDPGEPNAVRELLGRSIRGIPADVRWRYRTLLEQRGVRQRSQDMTTSIRSNWWVILTAILGVALLAVSGASAAVIGSGGDGGNFWLIGAVVGVISGGLVIGGLVLRQRNLITGSRLIFAGSAMTLIGGLELIPIGMIVLISGFWTGNLRLSEREDEPALQPVRRQQVDMTNHWYMWLVAAAGLFGFGFGVLVLADFLEGSSLDCGDNDPDGCLADSAVWVAWIFSWLGAIVTAGIGVVLGTLRGVVRHRTRLA